MWRFLIVTWRQKVDHDAHFHPVDNLLKLLLEYLVSFFALFRETVLAKA